jgi:hypothetical protein
VFISGITAAGSAPYFEIWARQIEAINLQGVACNASPIAASTIRAFSSNPARSQCPELQEYASDRLLTRAFLDMPDDLLMLAAGRAGGNVAPESLGSSHRRGYAIGLATVAQAKAIADAIIAEELRSVSQQKLADAPGDSPGTRQRPAIRRRRAGW